MDELNFRRKVFTDPKNKDVDFIAETNASEENQQLVKDMQDFDQLLETAMDVTPPSALAERIKLKQTLGQHTIDRQWNRKLLAIAASVLIVFSLAFNLIVTKPPLSALQTEILAHLNDEVINLNAQQNKTVADANETLKNFGGELTLARANFNYVGNCTIAGTEGVHMVVDGEQGAVTVFLLPNIKQQSASSFSNNEFDGKLIPTDKGMMAVIGNKGEALDKIQNNLQQNISWII